MIYIIMGVMGSGKTTIGKALAKRLNCNFHDGNSHHSKENRKKMRKGQPLTDEDRELWLTSLRMLLETEAGYVHGSVVECSALKKKYRDKLTQGIKNICFVFLKGSKEIIMERLKNRDFDYENPGLIDSQFEALEGPEDAIIVDISKTPEQIVDRIINESN